MLNPISYASPAISRGAKFVKKTNTIIKSESKELIRSLKKGDIKSVLKVKNPANGVLKYGALGFLVPIPGLQIVGMAAGAIAGCVPLIKNLSKKLITKIK